ncbi:odorant receptor 13a-like isoform X1 [Neodiprion virginianus]|uniref:odorant receptor 13a-like isoform X1 n=2 Tax=Neodiprion virginianus TaxID=2961670 RepID=UPI001EE6970D|nr:odorant receptor 13a-like isoform X1 [Neodiprion virginianus]XP_046610957.1 odorant receptor 13a-like isoform X1 [Neodiprion virginianus]XP_046610958.1 odorant receptor 13a-like isoform X1 [Neodiprion virginianus]XP_046610959.1 odorant receptor 13a-like isoform X1 [Neodiprion virginianus]
MTLSLNPDSSSGTITMYKYNLSFLGVWPFQKKGIRYTIHLGLILLTQVTLAIPEYIDLALNIGDVDKTIENLTCVVTVNMVIVKLIIMHIHRDSMVSCVNLVVADWDRIQSAEARRTMKRHRSWSKAVFLAAMALLYVSYALYIVLAVTVTATSNCSGSNANGSCKMLPIRANYVVNTDLSPLYEIVVVLQSVQGMITCTANYGVDTFMFFLTMHVCGQLEILQINLRRFVSADAPRPNILDARIFRKKIRILSERHCELVDFSLHIEETLNVIILGLLLFSSVLICLIGFRFILSVENGDLFGAGKYISYLTAILGQLFLYCFAGDYLQSQSLGLASAAYETHWYNLPPDIARDLLFAMIRAKNPLRISAGKFFFMTLESFKVILKTSASYLSLLRVIVERSAYEPKYF